MFTILINHISERAAESASTDIHGVRNRRKLLSAAQMDGDEVLELLLESRLPQGVHLCLRNLFLCEFVSVGEGVDEL